MKKVTHNDTINNSLFFHSDEEISNRAHKKKIIFFNEDLKDRYNQLEVYISSNESLREKMTKRLKELQAIIYKFNKPELIPDYHSNPKYKELFWKIKQEIHDLKIKIHQLAIEEEKYISEKFYVLQENTKLQSQNNININITVDQKDARYIISSSLSDTDHMNNFLCLQYLIQKNIDQMWRESTKNINDLKKLKEENDYNQEKEEIINDIIAKIIKILNKINITQREFSDILEENFSLTSLYHENTNFKEKIKYIYEIYHKFQKYLTKTQILKSKYDDKYYYLHKKIAQVLN